MASVVSTLSSHEYCFTAETMPSTTPRPTPRMVEVMASVSVQGKRDMMDWNTGWPLR